MSIQSLLIRLAYPARVRPAADRAALLQLRPRMVASAAGAAPDSLLDRLWCPCATSLAVESSRLCQ